MPYILEQRRVSSGLPQVRDWQECADSKRPTQAEVEQEQKWWEAYDAFYMLTGWEYRICEVKK